MTDKFNTRVKEKIVTDIVNGDFSFYRSLLFEMLFRKAMKYKTHNSFLVKLLITVFKKDNIQVKYQKSMNGRRHFYIVSLNQNIEKCPEIKKFDNNLVLRALFLFKGFISDPNNGYQMGFSIHSSEYYQFLCSYLSENQIEFRIFKRRRDYLFRITKKTGVLFLFGKMNASFAVLYLENMDLIKNFHNRANRETNLVTANIRRQALSAQRMIEKIKLLEREKKLDDLPNYLKEMTVIRQQNPYKTMSELIKLYDLQITKSGLSKRFKRIEQLALKYRGSRR